MIGVYLRLGPPFHFDVSGIKRGAEIDDPSGGQLKDGGFEIGVDSGGAISGKRITIRPVAS